MKGLLLKDGYLTARLCRSLLLIDLVFIITSIFSNENFFLVSYPCIISGVMPMTLIAYEEKEKWDQFAGTLPLTRAQLVSSKYILVLLSTVVITVLTALAQAYKMLGNGTAAFGEYIAVMSLLLAISLVLPSVLYPFIYKFGAEKGRMIYYCVFGAGWAAALSLDKLSLRRQKASLLTGEILLGAVLLFAASWLLSIHFYKKREL